MLQPEEIGDVPKDKTCCLNCRFYEHRTGFCRFNPPTPMNIRIGEQFVTTSNFPRISLANLDWCGQFQNINE